MQLLDIRPISRYVVVRKCVNDHVRNNDGDVLIYKPDYIYETTNWAQILKVSEDCKVLTDEHVGCLVECPEFSSNLHRLGSESDSVDFFVREDEILKYHPFIVEN